jgi:hypothetical protein
VAGGARQKKFRFVVAQQIAHYRCRGWPAIVFGVRADHDQVRIFFAGHVEYHLTRVSCPDDDPGLELELTVESNAKLLTHLGRHARRSIRPPPQITAPE